MSEVEVLQGLTANEQIELLQLEERITGAFYEIGQALSAIRDKRLYRADYKTFEDYCNDRWNFSRRRVDQLIAAADVVENLRTIGSHLPTPTSERQVRPLVGLKPERQAQLYQDSVETAPRGKPTAEHVSQTVDRNRQTHPVEDKFKHVEDITVPTLEELKSLYSQIGVIEPTVDGYGFAVTRPDLGNPFPIVLRTRAIAWDYWQLYKDKLLAIAERKPLSQEYAARALPERIDRVETQTPMERSPTYSAKPAAPPLPQKEYLCIVADPPWKYDLRVEDETHRNRIPYPPMEIEEILALPIPELCSKDGAVLWLWYTNNHMIEAGQCIRHWGFTLKTILTWEKVTQAGNVAIGTGHWLRNATEHCALAVKGSVPSFRHTGTLTNQSNVIRASRREHSRKPDEFYQLVDQLCPNSSKLELFARQQREGWEAWGNETTLFSA